MRNLILGGFLVSFGLSLSSLICLVFISLGLSDYRILNRQQILGAQSSGDLLALIQEDRTTTPPIEHVTPTQVLNVPTGNLQAVSPTVGIKQPETVAKSPNKSVQIIIYIVGMTVIILVLVGLFTYKKKLKAG